MPCSYRRRPYIPSIPCQVSAGPAKDEEVTALAQHFHDVLAIDGYSIRPVYPVLVDRVLFQIDGDAPFPQDRR